MAIPTSFIVNRFPPQVSETGAGGPSGQAGGPRGRGMGGPPPISTRPGPPAEFVRFPTSDRMMLHALLWQPKKGGKTAAIYIPGFGGSFACPNDLNPVAEILTERGYAFFAMNVRTVVPPGIMYARFEDCVPDIDGAVQFLKARGFTHVVLIGDSLGTPRAMHYLKEKDEAAIEGLIVLGGIPSPYLEAQQRWDDDNKDRFDRFLDEARKAVKDGRERELLTFDDWFPGTALTLSAASFLNMFGPPGDSPADAVDSASAVEVPTLVLHGSNDTTSVPENARTIYTALTHAAKRDLVFVNCDHFFFTEAQARTYGTEIANWLERVLPQ